MGQLHGFRRVWHDNDSEADCPHAQSVPVSGDTGLYYLQSRYYNPQWGRFLNADGYVNANGDLIGFNMYAYCGNNPVNRVDSTGQFWKELWDAFTQTIQ